MFRKIKTEIKDTPSIDIVSGILVLFFMSMFVLAMSNSFKQHFDKEVAKKLYYLTVMSTIYALSLVCFICAKSLFFKICTVVGLGISAVNLYVELFLDPRNWTNWSIGLLVIVPLNLFLTIFIIERIKRKKNG